MFARFPTISAASLLPRPCFKPPFWQLRSIFAAKGKETFRPASRRVIVQHPSEMTGRALPRSMCSRTEALS